MTSNSDAPLFSLTNQPAFLVGVSGHMDLRDEELEPLKERVRLLFRCLKPAWKQDGRNAQAARKELHQRWSAQLQNVISQLPETTGLPESPDERQPYRDALDDWPRLEHTPIIVLSSLAPGADTLVAEVALEDEFKQNGFIVVAPLPLPPDEYVRSSSFVWQGDSPEETQRRQAKFNELREKIPAGDQFVVLTDDDMKLPASELPERYRNVVESEDFRSERHQRYRAAGEYMAAYAHLLIAIWDHHHDADTTVGTAAIVAARRSGPQANLLPTSPALVIPHGGPTIQLYTRRKKNDLPPKPAPLLRFLQAHNSEHPSPDDGNRSDNGNADDQDASWQRQGLTLMTRIAANLDRFNEIGPLTPTRLKDELCNRLTYRDPQGALVCFAGVLQEQNPPFVAPLSRLAALRRSASDASNDFSKESKKTIVRLFFLTILAAIALDFFAHWHPQIEAGAEKHDTGEQGAHADSISGESGPEDAARPGTALAWCASCLTQARIGLIILVAGLLALIWFWWRRSQHRPERMHDYRAIAEGARVQFYWHLAGVGESVSANYMDRQRNELDWIRGSIRAASFPYENARLRFAKLPASLQIKALRCVLYGWIEDQRSYFRKNSRQYETQLHYWHKLGNVLALAGLLLVLLLVGDAWTDGHMRWLCGKYGVLFAFSTGLAIAWLCAVWAWQRWRNGCDAERKTNRATKSKTSFEWLKTNSCKLFDFCLPTTNAHQFPHSRRRTLVAMLINFLLHLPLAMVIALGILGMVILSTDCAGTLPGARDLTIVAASSLLILGAMAVAWLEKNLYSELAYQYNTMLSLFENAHVYIKRQIERLAELDAERQQPASTVQASQANSDAGRTGEPLAEAERNTEYDRLLRVIQQAILELGMEALDENAEWLILHRARPLEPVMAG